MYKKGEGLDQDLVQAYFWFLIKLTPLLARAGNVAKSF